MNNALALSAGFERQKNIQASIYTAVIAGALLLVVLLVKFYEPIVPTPPVQETIEINLGSSDKGSGKDQPQLPGEPAPQQQTAYTPSQPVTHTSTESVKDVEENNDKDAAPVLKPTVSKPDAKKLNEESKTEKAKTVEAPPTPAPPRPRAVMGTVRGGNGNGGNGAQTYKPGTGEGPGDGPGDKGSIGGNPNGKDYTPRRISTTKIVNIAGREFQDDFTESGKIVLDLTVDENANLVSATYQPKGSSISNRNQIEIAKRRAKQLQYPKMPGGFIQPYAFVFDVR